MRLQASLLCVVTLAGCGTSNPPVVDAPVMAKWDMASFRVQFRAGEKGVNGKTNSSYEITHLTPKDSLVLESAHTIDGFKSVTNSHPKNWIRLIEDSEGNALLIEEEIPNDCGPCSNYLFVSLDSKGHVVGTYLRLPSEKTGEHGGINYEYPKVRSLDGDVLRYEYSSGSVVSKSVDRIEKANEPMSP